MQERFFPTKELKDANDRKPIQFIPEDGKDVNSMWDVLAETVWPSTLVDKTHREVLADEIMSAIYAEESVPIPNIEIILARITQRLMGNEWMLKWIDNNKKMPKHNQLFKKFSRYFK